MRSELEERLKRRREFYLILIGLILFTLFAFLEFKAFQILPFKFSDQNLIIFALIQINLILLLLVIYLVLRNLLKTIFEARNSRLSRSLRLRLTLSFVVLSFIPALLLFAVSYRFIETSLEYWFGSNLDQQLEKALFEARAYYQDKEREILVKTQSFINNYVKKTRRLSSKYVGRYRKKLSLASLEIYDAQGHLLKKSYAREIKNPLGIPPSLLSQILSEKSPLSETSDLEGKVLLRVFVLTAFKQQPVIVAGGEFLDPGLEKLIKDISSGVGLYQQLKFLKGPLKTSLLLVLLLVTLLTIFVGLWFGMRFARRLTEPLQELTEAAGRIASRDFEVSLPQETSDEVGILVRAFREMARELKLYRERVEETTRALSEANEELSRRTAYLETVLAHITAGVIAVDQEERITLLNRRARELLNLEPSASGKSLHDVLPESLYLNFKDLLEKVPRDRPLSTPVRLYEGERHLVLGITVVRLPEEAFPGYLFILEDFTEKERMERLAAWREVARRIAHEVKNPLTPIQLSAQRLRRKLSGKLSPEDGEILFRCTTTIENQVEELKHLVNEFSAFARLPGLKLEENDLTTVIRETIALYEEAHREIEFRFEAGKVPPFLFDRDQMKRVLLNLFDNAISALSGKGMIEVRLYREGEWVFLEVTDNGPGIPSELKARLFEPYASGKGSTGLGLAIVNSIVQGHGGEVRAEDHQPHGARFIVKLPFRRREDA
ncbi:MAG TPA: HAMP domain-containing protein [Thermodesulfobacteriaceae bacterium]|nr:HAMP domain-containing protein [Thermodesulfobacteriaceae bacterium]